MTYFLLSSTIALLSMLAIDAVWLTVIAKNLYATQIGHLLAPKPNLLAAGIFYVIFAAALAYFVILPNRVAAPLLHIFFAGVFFGLVTYATYDLTNQATLRDWPVIVTCIDLLWGSFLSGVLAVSTTIILRTFFRT